MQNIFFVQTCIFCFVLFTTTGFDPKTLLVQFFPSEINSQRSVMMEHLFGVFTTSEMCQERKQRKTKGKQAKTLGKTL